ncbi:MAG: tRNA-dihydrouridine synthase family protein [Bacilli bacterium]|nr:tRNA-dihydrouridine synthase family protein [Bacilli bacterium]
MWNIDHLIIDGVVVLAPMAGVTSSGYRQFMKPFGVAVSVTEMVSDMGLIYDNDETNKYVIYPEEHITGVQLFGHTPETIAKAGQLALKLNPNIDFFDINMGCPVNKVVDTGAGSSLIKNPKLCGEIVKALKEATNKPVTAKIRLGWDNNNLTYLEVIDELEKAGVAAIAIHARTRKEMYMGNPHYELLKDLRKQMHVPLIISGNIFTLDDAINAKNITGADAIMVARGAMGNPWLIKQIDHYYRTGERLENKTVLDQIKYCEELADYYIQEKGEATAMRIYRGISTKFFSGFKNAKYYKNRLCMELTDRESLTRILNEMKEEITNQ